MVELTPEDWLRAGGHWLNYLERSLASWLNRTNPKQLYIYGTGSSALLVGECLQLIRPAVLVSYCEKRPHRSHLAQVPVIGIESLPRGSTVIVASSRKPAQLEEVCSLIQKQECRPVLLRSILSDLAGLTANFFQMMPPGLREQFLSDNVSVIWDSIGIEWSDRLKSGETSRQGEILLKIIQENGWRRVLEVGTGSGRICSSWEDDPRSPFFVGTDVSLQMLQRNPIRNKIQANRLLPFKDDSFDLVFTVACAQHQPPQSIDAFLQELVRVSRKSIIHWEHRWPGDHQICFDHNLTQWYLDRGYPVKNLASHLAQWESKHLENLQFILVEFDFR